MSLRRVVRKTYSSNPSGPGWVFNLYLGAGAGYRTLDYPWHSSNVLDPKWRRRPWVSYLPGVTVTIGKNQRHMFTRRIYPRWGAIRTNGNNPVVPAWW